MTKKNIHQLRKGERLLVNHDTGEVSVLSGTDMYKTENDMLLVTWPIKKSWFGWVMNY
jgi:hypothetical protein